LISRWWRRLSLRSKMFFSFGLLVLFSTALIATYAISLTTGEMDAYALRAIDRNIQYVSREIGVQLRYVQGQAILFANDKTVRDSLDGYAGGTVLSKYERWLALSKTCDLWVATRQLSDIRFHLHEDLQFLRDGFRFISGTDVPELLRSQQGEREVWWQLFPGEGRYSCFTSLTSWRSMGYVEIQMDATLLLQALDTQPQTGMELFLTDGQLLMGADGVIHPYALDMPLPDHGELQHMHQTHQGVKMLYTALKMEDYPLYLIGQMPAALLGESGMHALRSIVALLAAVLVVAFLLAWFISRSVFSRLEKLKSAMAQVEQGRLHVQVDEASTDEMGQILSAFNHMASELEITTEAALRNQRISKETELRLLQAQINPHFIYNTLESISWAAQSHDTAHVHYLVRNLSDFLRASLSKTQQMSTVAQELATIRSYWNIQAYRFGERISLDVQAAPEVMDVPLLPMLLQPLVENALLHGLLPRQAPGQVWLRIESCDGLLIVEVEDDGVGIHPHELDELQCAIESQREGSYGLWNVHQRVRTQYGAAFGLSVQSAPGEGTVCILTIPHKIENE